MEGSSTALKFEMEIESSEQPPCEKGDEPNLEFPIMASIFQMVIL